MLEELTVDTSYNYLTKKLHIKLVESKKENGKTVSDKGYASLALGGLTEGMTVLEMNAAYAAFANGGEYIEPSSYTTVYDANGNVLLDKTPVRNRAFSEETAFLVSQMLKTVVQSGTAAGSSIPGIETCGKTGSTDKNMDRWFSGYTPYYSAVVWVGYDEQKVISYAGNNPALTIWSEIMERIHKNLPDKSFAQPDFVKKVYICSNTGQYGTGGCPGVTDYANIKLMTGYCDGIHNHHIGTPGVLEEEKPEDEENENENETPSDGDDDKNDDTEDKNNSSDNETTPKPSTLSKPSTPPNDENISEDAAYSN